MNTDLIPDFSGDASARPKYTEVQLTREQTRKRNSFPIPDNNRFIDAFMRKQRMAIKHGEGK